MKIRYRRLLVKVIPVLALTLTLTLALFGCTTANSIFPAQGRQDKVGSVHTHILSVIPWDDYKSQLITKFSLDETGALNEIIPTTLVLQKQIQDLVAARLEFSVTKDGGSGGDKKADSGEDGKEEGGADDAEGEGDEKAAEGGESPPEEESPSGEEAGGDDQSAGDTEGDDDKPEKESDKSEGLNASAPALISGQKIDYDPFLKYDTAASLLQHVRLRNIELAEAAIPECYQAYVVRINLRLHPLARNMPYDAYTTLSFFYDRPSHPISVDKSGWDTFLKLIKSSPNSDNKGTPPDPNSPEGKLLALIKSVLTEDLEGRKRNVLESELDHRISRMKEIEKGVDAVLKGYPEDGVSSETLKVIKAVPEASLWEMEQVVKDVLFELKKQKETRKEIRRLRREPEYFKRTSTPLVIPFLVTDNLESALSSASLETTRQFLLAVTAMFEGIGGGVDLENTRKEIDKILGSKLNSLLSVGSLTDNTLRVRLGGMQQTVKGKSAYVAVPRENTITCLVMVPKSKLTEKKPREVHISARTVFAHSWDGKKPDFRKKRHWRKQLGHIRRDWELKFGRSDAKEKLMELSYLVAENRFLEFKSEIEDKLDSPSLVMPLWLELTDQLLGSEWAVMSFKIKPLKVKNPEPEIPTDLTALLLDNEKILTAEISGTRRVDVTKTSAILRIKPKNGTGGKTAGYTLASRSISLQKNGLLKIVFPSLIKWGLKKEGDGLEIKITTRWQRGDPCLGSSRYSVSKPWIVSDIKDITDTKPLLKQQYLHIATSRQMIAANQTGGNEVELIFKDSLTRPDEYSNLKDRKNLFRFKVEGAGVKVSWVKFVTNPHQADLSGERDLEGWYALHTGIVKLTLSGLTSKESVKITFKEPENIAEAGKLPEEITLPVVESSEKTEAEKK